MWNIDAMNMPEWIKGVFKLNPMFYVVNGYRDALINKVAFWERGSLSIYFWILTAFFVLLWYSSIQKIEGSFCRCAVGGISDERLCN